MSVRDDEVLRMTRAELVAEARARGLPASGWETREELLKVLGVRPPARGLVARAREILQVAREALGLADLVFDSRIDQGGQGGPGGLAGSDRPWARTRAEEAAEEARLARAVEAARDIEHSFVEDEEDAAARREALDAVLAGAGVSEAAGHGGEAPGAAETLPSAVDFAPPEIAAPAGPGLVPAPVPPAEAAGDGAVELRDGADFVAATARSATELYVQWRITAGGVERARAKLGEGNGRARPVLRLVTWDLGAEAQRRVEDHLLEAGAGERVLGLPEGGAVFVAAVGVGITGGAFAPAAHCPRGSTEGPRHEPPPAELEPPVEPGLPAPATAEALAAALALEPGARQEAPPRAAAPPPPVTPSLAAQRRTLRREDRRKARLERRSKSRDREERTPRARRDRDRDRRRR